MWTDFGTTGDPPVVAGTNPAAIYYLGPQIELEAYESGEPGGALTFIVNTAFVQDIVDADYGSTVSIRGGGIFGDGSEEMALKLTNIGGDYWKGTIVTDQTQSGGTAKIVTITETGTGVDPVTIPDFAITGNKTIRLFTSGLKTTYTDPVTGLEQTRDMNWNPLEIAKGESNNIAVHFRVNLSGNVYFSRETAEVYVRGSILDDSWSVLPEGRLYPEVRHDDLTGGYEAEKFFYSRTVLVDPSKAGKNLEYKFTFNSAGSTTWEAISNRKVTLSGKDTTLAWVYWPGGGDPFPPSTATYDINFEVDLFNAINTNGFDPAIDTVVVRAGYAGSSGEIQELTLTAPLFGTVYTGTMEDFDGYNNRYVAYQYYKVNGSLDQEEFYFDNYDETGIITGPKFRKILTPADTAGFLLASDLLDDAVSTHRMPFFRNFNPVGANTSLIVEADLMPAICFVTVGEGSLEDLHGGSLVINAANIADYPVYINGPATGGWADWDSVSLGDSRRMSDDGITRGDKVAGDNIWTITLQFDASSTISQEYKLSIGGADNEGGFGNNHVANLFPKDVNNVSVQFGEIHPSRYENPGTGYWDFSDHIGPCSPGVGVDDDPAKSINDFLLLQNYPNPFNPSTMISFTVAKAGVVNFTVYNVLGQEVAAFDAEVPSAGTHQIPFTARNLASGTYLVKLQVGNHTDIIRILLTK
ncbi:MAG: T9SS type A sorting domain-containing protein [Bacteroidetes bacterium]|nr:T9SS type A sorting domain-containing protein [Bacteroidota bacterium]